MIYRIRLVEKCRERLKIQKGRLPPLLAVYCAPRKLAGKSTLRSFFPFSLLDSDLVVVEIDVLLPDLQKLRVRKPVKISSLIMIMRTALRAYHTAS
jgi:hypothetical protein